MTRIAVLVIRQESNSFVPGETQLATFVESGLKVGDDMLTPGTDIYVDGFRDALAAELPDAELVPIVRAATVAGPPVATATLDQLTQHVRDGLSAAGQIDAVLAGLHGAFVTVDGKSADAHIAATIRDVIGSATPFVVGLDHHGWITPELTERVDALVGHRTQPHDLYDTAVGAGQLLVRRLRTSVRPQVAHRRLPMVTHQERFPTASGPMSEWFGLARELEQRSGIWSISTFPMQPWLDVETAGWTVVVTGDPDGPAVPEAADQLADFAWERRHDFVTQHSKPTADAVASAITHASDPNNGIAVLADLGDAVFGGAHGDSVELLHALRSHELPGPALVPITDPAAAVTCHTAGTGSQITTTVGGAFTGGDAVTVSGTVRATAEGQFTLPDFIHEKTDLGRCALLECVGSHGPILLMITERSGISGNHPRAYERLGVDMATARLAVLKSAANVQGFTEHRPTLFLADTAGSTQSNLAALPWQRRPTPLFPFEPVPHWREPPAP